MRCGPGTAPDVFTDHLSKFAEFADKKLLLPLDDAVTKDGINTDIYAKGLSDL
jgi:multiple sugar transport system substrate-binding protein